MFCVLWVRALSSVYCWRWAVSTLRKSVCPSWKSFKDRSTALRSAVTASLKQLVVHLLLREGDKGVLHVLEGGQHGLLIRNEGLVAEGLLDVDVGNDGAALEDGPRCRGADEEPSGLRP